MMDTRGKFKADKDAINKEINNIHTDCAKNKKDIDQKKDQLNKELNKQKWKLAELQRRLMLNL